VAAAVLAYGMLPPDSSVTIAALRAAHKLCPQAHDQRSRPTAFRHDNPEPAGRNGCRSRAASETNEAQKGRKQEHSASRKPRSPT